MDGAWRAYDSWVSRQVTAVACYLAVVLLGVVRLKALGPGAKKSSGPLLRLTVQAHNLFLIVLSSWMSASACLQAWRLRYRFWGNAYSDSQASMATVVYFFYVSKLYEFTDTVIMLLKGNAKQVSFLHVYHHMSISCIWWAIAFAAPGGDAWYSVFLNSLVHVFMYAYYFAATALSDNPAARRRYLWWGRYLTQFQMFQFVTMMAQAAYCWRFSPYPKPLSKLLFFYMQTLLALFAHFYVQKYLSGAKRGRSGANGKITRAVENGSANGKDGASRHAGANGLGDCKANGHTEENYTIAAAGKKGR
ncbi:hypothetical protein WJX81_000104 [Elliptochloris bilobata]|uniref:Very-long-chain 3-oxoacyl-CoA synthase n=1 Tax=Elliptochloris bilobata TaxID=381761 RepID=A0AAW1R0U5_9CHLO